MLSYTDAKYYHAEYIITTLPYSHPSALALQRPTHSLVKNVLKRVEQVKKKQTHLLESRSQQRPILAINLLHDHTPPVAGPRALHLGEHPLVGLDLLGVVEVDGVVEADHHADLGAVLVLVEVAVALPVVELGQVLAHVGLEAGHVLEPHRVPPQLVDAADGADEVRVADVRERAEVRLVAALVADAPARAHPLPHALVLGLLVRVVRLAPEALERVLVAVLAPRPQERRLRVIVGRRLGGGARRHGGRVRRELRAPAALPHEAARHREDGVAALPRLHRARAEGAPLAHALHMVQDGHAGVAREHEEAVVRVHDEVGRDCALGRLFRSSSAISKAASEDRCLLR